MDVDVEIQVEFEVFFFRHVFLQGFFLFHFLGYGFGMVGVVAVEYLMGGFFVEHLVAGVVAETVFLLIVA